MLTRRQKNSIRGFTAVLSCCALLAAFLIYTNISNAEKPERVVFSEILEGAVAYSDDETPAITLASDKLMETMFSEKYATFTLPEGDPYTATYIPPSTLNTDDMQIYAVTPDETDEFTGIPDNPNEITLLSDELEELRTGTSDDTTTSAETTKADTEQSSSDSTTKIIYEITAPSDIPRTEITPASTSHNENSIIITETTTVKTTTTAKTTTAKTTKAQTTVTTTKNAGGTTSRPPITNVGGGKFSEDDTVYLTMLKLVNDARREAGVSELWYSARVHEVCRTRANELSSYYSHNRPDGTKFSTAFKEIGINYSKCGENIAYGRNMFDTPEEVFKAWMDSPSHRENILSPDYECMAFGLSVLKVGNDTYYYWAQEFAKF